MLFDCTDFIYDHQSLFDFGFMIASFEAQNELPFGLERTVDKGDRNKSRERSNVLGVLYTEDLLFTITIIKDICTYPTPEQQIISESDLRNIACWLTSPLEPLWLETISDGTINDIRYCGIFTNIEPVLVGNLYGLTLSFQCVSPFGYTHDIQNVFYLNGKQTLTIKNNSDAFYEYAYPTISIQPTENTDLVLINLSESKEVDSGQIAEEVTDKLLALTNKVKDYARRNDCTVKFVQDETLNIKPFCEGTLVVFYLTDSNNKESKYVAYYDETYKYYIYCGCFLVMSLYADLSVLMHCLSNQIYDGIGRPVRYSKLGIKDVDYMYWPRLLNGTNTIFCYANNCVMSVTHQESRKVGAY